MDPLYGVHDDRESGTENIKKTGRKKGWHGMGWLVPRGLIVETSIGRKVRVVEAETTGLRGVIKFV